MTKYKYKLIVYAGGEYETDEFDYPVANLKETAKKIDELVSDKTVFEEYADIHFVNDDFLCTAFK